MNAEEENENAKVLFKLTRFRVEHDVCDPSPAGQRSLKNRMHLKRIQTIQDTVNGF